MNSRDLLSILRKVKHGEITPEAACFKLSSLPYVDLGFAKTDTHRALRQGYPEVIYAPGKRPEQLKAIVLELARTEKNVMITRLTKEAFDAVAGAVPESQYYPLASLAVINCVPLKSEGRVLVATGGTADLPVAEETATVLEVFGHDVRRLYDVGVAGIHRLLNHQDDLAWAHVIVAIAGMDGALASVIAGIVSQPVIAVPTSTGYGASFQGLAALLAMLNSCATGVSVVNIDNGFGAATVAHAILNAGGKRNETRLP